MSVIADDALCLPHGERLPNARYRIAMIAACPMPARRGTPVRIERLANAVSARGHHVELLTYHIGDHAQVFDFPVHRIFTRPKYWRMPAGPSLRKLLLYDPALALKVWRLLGEKQFDVIHAHHMEGLLVSIPARLRCGLPMIYDAHTMLSSELPTYWPAPMRAAIRGLGGWLDGALPRRADHVVAVTPDLRARLIGEHGFGAGNVTVVTNGVEMERFTDVLPPAPDGFVRLMYSGTLAPYQNIGLLLEAFARARRTRPDLRLVFSVSSSFAPYESQAQRLGIREHIELLPDSFDELAARLAGAALAVVPRTKCDGIPQKLLNYMAAGKAIVVSAGSAKLVEHERTALVVPNDDVAAFAKAILRVADSPALAQRLGCNAREHVQKHYSWQMAAERLEGVYAAAVRSTVPVRA